MEPLAVLLDTNCLTTTTTAGGGTTSWATWRNGGRTGATKSIQKELVAL